MKEEKKLQPMVIESAYRTHCDHLTMRYLISMLQSFHTPGHAQIDIDNLGPDPWEDARFGGGV